MTTACVFDVLKRFSYGCMTSDKLEKRVTRAAYITPRLSWIRSAQPKLFSALDGKVVAVY